FIADIHARAIRRKVDAVRQLNAADHLNNTIRSRIDHVHGGSRAVGNVDQRPAVRVAAGTRTSTADPLGEGEPIRVVLRLELPATGVERVATRFRSEWMNQEQAGTWITRGHEPGYRLEVSPRLFLGPLRSSLRQAFKVKNPIRIRVASVTASVTGTLLQENGFDFRFEKVEIKIIFRRSGSCLLRLGRICRLRRSARLGPYAYAGTGACHRGNHEHREPTFSKIQHLPNPISLPAYLSAVAAQKGQCPSWPVVAASPGRTPVSVRRR